MGVWQPRRVGITTAGPEGPGASVRDHAQAHAGARTPSGHTARVARWDGVGLPVSVVTVPLPEALAPGEVLVEVDLATVCGSDVHTVSGRRPSPAPGVLGHEQVGRVVAVGPDEPRSTRGQVLTAGTRVVWSLTASCGACARCAANLPQKCLRLRKYGHEPFDDAWPLNGGFATHCLLRPGTAIVPVPEEVPDPVASPASCATATVMAVLRAAGPLAGRRLLVSGAGMLGLTAVTVAVEAGAHVTAVDPHPGRRAAAVRFGAHAVHDGTGPAPTVDVAVELSGAAAAVAACLDSVDVGGVVVLAGSVSPGPAVGLDPERVVRRLLTVTGVHNYRPVDLEEAVDFLAAHHDRRPFVELVEGAWGLGRLDDAFDAARSGGAPRQGVDPRR